MESTGNLKVIYECASRGRVPPVLEACAFGERNRPQHRAHHIQVPQLLKATKLTQAMISCA